MRITCERCGHIIHEDTHNFHAPAEYRVAMGDDKYLLQQKEYLKETTRLYLENIEHELANTRKEEHKIIIILDEVETRKNKLAEDFYTSIVGDYRRWRLKH